MTWLDGIPGIREIVHDGVRYPERVRVKIEGAQVSVDSTRVYVNATGVGIVSANPRLVWGKFNESALNTTGLFLTKSGASGVGPGESKVADISGSARLIIPPKSRWRLVFFLHATTSPVATHKVMSLNIETAVDTGFTAGLVTEHEFVAGGSDADGASAGTVGTYPFYGDVQIENATSDNRYIRWILGDSYGSPTNSFDSQWALHYQGAA